MGSAPTTRPERDKGRGVLFEMASATTERYPKVMSAGPPQQFLVPLPLAFCLTVGLAEAQQAEPEPEASDAGAAPAAAPNVPPESIEEESAPGDGSEQRSESVDPLAAESSSPPELVPRPPQAPLEESPAEPGPRSDGSQRAESATAGREDQTRPPSEDEYELGGQPLAPGRENRPERPRYDGPFRAGRLNLSLSLGGGTFGAETYFIPGANIGYFLTHGLEIHVDTDLWLLGDPFIATPSPGLRYVFWMVPRVHPYIGAFYRHYFVGGEFRDADSVGARAGVYLMTGGNSFFGLGAYYERVLQDELFAQQEFIGPEIAFAFSF